MRREEHYVGRMVMEVKVQGRRKRGRSRRRWLDKVTDQSNKREEVYDRATWRRISSYINPT